LEAVMADTRDDRSADGGFVVGRVRGIDIRLSWSVVVIVVVVAWSLADGLLPEFAEGYTTGEYWFAAVVLSVAFLAGLLAHELGHSLVAAREGVVVDSITLWLFGGVARLATSPTTPRCAIRIAAAGPAVSVALGITSIAAALVSGGLVGVGLGWYGAINLMLAGFNLLPAFPMDGGRIYQAWLWARSGDEVAATRKAAAVGHAIGGALVVLGLLEVLFAGAVGGVWLALIGWFVREAARAEVQRVAVVEPLQHIPVTEIMTTAPQRVLADGSVQSFVTEMVFGGRHAAYPVVRTDGSVVGLITVNAVRALDRDVWPTTTVGAAAIPLDRLTVVGPDANIADLAASLERDRDARALVMDGARLVGIVAPSDIARLITAVELAGPAGPALDAVSN
jgi:Zn-dependent protease/predicted transcriptional regulator